MQAKQTTHLLHFLARDFGTKLLIFWVSSGQSNKTFALSSPLSVQLYIF